MEYTAQLERLINNELYIGREVKVLVTIDGNDEMLMGYISRKFRNEPRGTVNGLIVTVTERLDYVDVFVHRLAIMDEIELLGQGPVTVYMTVTIEKPTGLDTETHVWAHFDSLEDAKQALDDEFKKWQADGVDPDATYVDEPYKKAFISPAHSNLSLTLQIKLD